MTRCREDRLDRVSVEPSCVRVGAKLGGGLLRVARRPGGRGSRIAWYPSAAPRIRAALEMEPAEMPRG
jgi:hypothetical protein